jgi:hypothetical protein
MVSLNLLLTYVDNIMFSAIFDRFKSINIYFFFIQVIGDRLQASLETQLLDAVSQDNRDALRRCLRIYATVDKVEINSTYNPVFKTGLRLSVRFCDYMTKMLMFRFCVCMTKLYAYVIVTFVLFSVFSDNLNQFFLKIC